MAKIKALWEQFKQALGRIHYDEAIVAVVGTILALLLRVSLRNFWSHDADLLTKWYLWIRAGGIDAIKEGLTNYPPLYVYIVLLTAKLFPHLWSLPAIKLPNIACDFLCAWFIFKIVRLKYPDGPVPLFAYLGALFAPTMVLNSSTWGQVDVVYTTGLIACVYFLLKEKGWLACLAFGIAFSFKFQAVFLAPLLLVLFSKRKIGWKELLIIPAVYLVTILPAWIAGRPLLDLLTIYLKQVNLFSVLTSAAPNMYIWFPTDNFNIFYPAAMLFGGSVCLIFLFSAYKGRAPMIRPVIVQLAMVSVLIVPYFLPLMHDRYFFPADVLSIVYGFYFPAYFFVPLLVNLVSFFTYQPFLFNLTAIPFPILALVELGVIVIVVRKMMLTLFVQNLNSEQDK